jgi:hypothetical protein
LSEGELGVTGEQLEWVITVTTPSAVTGTGILITDVLRPELRVDNVTTNRGTLSINGQAVSVNIATLAPNESVQISIFTTVLDGVTIVDNTACVVADNQGAQECATALPVSTLPSTGETPYWRLPLLLGLLGLGMMLLAIYRI